MINKLVLNKLFSYQKRMIKSKEIEVDLYIENRISNEFY